MAPMHSAHHYMCLQQNHSKSAEAAEVMIRGNQLSAGTFITRHRLPGSAKLCMSQLGPSVHLLPLPPFFLP